MAKTLWAGAKGQSVDAALGIGGKTGVSQDPTDVLERERPIAGFILRLTAFNGIPSADAKRIACVQFARPGESLDMSTVEKILRKHRLDDDDLTLAVLLHNQALQRLTEKPE